MLQYVRYLGLVLACGAFFTASTASAGFLGNRSIIGIDVGDTNRMIIRLSGDPICQGTTFVYVNKSDAWYSDMLAMALSAFAASKPINVYIPGCDGESARVLRMVQGVTY